MQARHADLVFSTASNDSAVARSFVAASWSRSLNYHHLDPDTPQAPERLTGRELDQAREQAGRLLSIARPAMTRLLQTVGDSGCCVLLTDADGVVLERQGSPSHDPAFNRWGLWTGAVWSEASEGTNGIGTCLVEKRAVTIHRDQHFHSRNTGMSCMDAPIFDERGRLAGALDVSSCRRDMNESLAGLIGNIVTEAARRIEAEHFGAAFSGHRILVAPGDSARGPALLAVDSDDLVVGATRAARQGLGLDDASLASPRPAADLLSAGSVMPGFDAAERSEIRRALARNNGNASATARELGIGRATLYRRMKRLGIE
ncbi:MAG: Fis family transcriptional regulator [Oceanicaulis sp.]|nr:Fis family transcriptional regulator [Maricaulis sp.]MBI74427.1 Fis family transcriptional regulator [Oceanicaulis sp.]